MILLKKRVFERLHSEMILKFTEMNPQFESLKNMSSARLYGFGEHSQKQDTLIAAILNDEYVLEVIKREKFDLNDVKISGKHLYRIKLEFASNKGSVRLRGIYQYLYPAFLGCSDINDFTQKFFNVKNTSDLRFYYLCYYYSFKNHKIKDFDLSINYNEEPYFCRIERFHDSSLEITETKYEGIGLEKNRCLYINTKSFENNEFNLILYLGNSKSMSLNILRGSFQGVSALSYPLAGEVVLTRLDKSKKKLLTPKEEKDIYYYLMMQRRMFRIPTSIVNKPEELKAKRYLHSEFQHLVGIYRIWTFNRVWEIMQTKFTISPEYDSFLEPPEYGNPNQAKQTCIISISQVNGMKICVSAHETRGTELINYAIIDFPSKENSLITKGVYCSVGIERKERALSASGYIVLLRDNTSFEPCKLLRADISRLRKTDGIYDKLYNELFDLYKKNGMQLH